MSARPLMLSREPAACIRYPRVARAYLAGGRAELALQASHLAGEGVNLRCPLRCGPRHLGSKSHRILRTPITSLQTDNGVACHIDGGGRQTAKPAMLPGLQRRISRRHLHGCFEASALGLEATHAVPLI